MKTVYNRITFRSGIRKISVFNHTIESAKRFLATIEPDAWTDKTWNWTIESVKPYPTKIGGTK